MSDLGLLEGSHEATGWGPLEREARSGRLDVLLFDRDAWALVRAPAPPASFEGLTPREAPAGLYLDPQGNPLYVAGGRLVKGPREVIAVLGEDARRLLDELGDPDVVLERLGRAH